MCVHVCEGHEHVCACVCITMGCEPVCMCVHMCVRGMNMCVCMHNVCMCLYIHIEARGSCHVSSAISLPPVFIEAGFLTEPWSSVLWLTKWSACLHP